MPIYPPTHNKAHPELKTKKHLPVVALQGEVPGICTGMSFFLKIL